MGGGVGLEGPKQEASDVLLRITSLLYCISVLDWCPSSGGALGHGGHRVGLLSGRWRSLFGAGGADIRQLRPDRIESADGRATAALRRIRRYWSTLVRLFYLKPSVF